MTRERIVHPTSIVLQVSLPILERESVCVREREKERERERERQRERDRESMNASMFMPCSAHRVRGQSQVYD